jgi:hypothetical protein
LIWKRIQNEFDDREGSAIQPGTVTADGSGRDLHPLRKKGFVSFIEALRASQGQQVAGVREETTHVEHPAPPVTGRAPILHGIENGFLFGYAGNTSRTIHAPTLTAFHQKISSVIT